MCPSNNNKSINKLKYELIRSGARVGILNIRQFNLAQLQQGQQPRPLASASCDSVGTESMTDTGLLHHSAV